MGILFVAHVQTACNGGQNIGPVKGRKNLNWILSV